MAETPRRPDAPAVPGSAVSGIVYRNIHALLEVRKEFERRKRRQDRVADAITAFAGSMGFVYVHILVYGGWIVINLGLIPGIKAFDPFPFVMLAMIASVEAIFLSTFILISQNRMTELADQRADLDLQISLLAEHEVTRLIHMTDAIARHLKVPTELADMEELKKDVRPEVVVQQIEQAQDDAKP